MSNEYEAVPVGYEKEDDLLTRYGEWAKDRRKFGCCGSAEGKYKPRGGGLFDDIPIKDRPELMPDFSAVEIQRTLLKLPEYMRLALQIWYIPSKMNIDRVLRMHRINRCNLLRNRNKALTLFRKMYIVKASSLHTVCKRPASHREAGPHKEKTADKIAA